MNAIVSQPLQYRQYFTRAIKPISCIHSKMNMETSSARWTQATQIASIPQVNLVLHATLKEAYASTEQESTMKLDEDASMRLMAALDNPPPANEKLQRLFQTHFAGVKINER